MTSLIVKSIKQFVFESRGEFDCIERVLIGIETDVASLIKKHGYGDEFLSALRREMNLARKINEQLTELKFYLELIISKVAKTEHFLYAEILKSNSAWSKISHD